MLVNLAHSELAVLVNLIGCVEPIVKNPELELADIISLLPPKLISGVLIVPFTFNLKPLSVVVPINTLPPAVNVTGCIQAEPL